MNSSDGDFSNNGKDPFRDGDAHADRFVRASRDRSPDNVPIFYDYDDFEPNNARQTDGKGVVDRLISHHEGYGPHFSMEDAYGINGRTNAREKRNTDILYAGLKPTRYGFENENKFGHRVYRLKGYTTVGKIKRKYQMERHQRLLRNLLTILMIIILVVILMALYNPFKDVTEFEKIFGENSYFEKSGKNTGITETTEKSLQTSSPTS